METLPEAMARVKAHTTLKAYCEANLEPRPRDGRNHYVCPKCKSGNRRGDGRGTADFHIDDTNPEKFKCFSCGWRGDLFDLAGLLIGRTEDSTEARAAQCNAVAEWAGVDGWHRSADTRGRAVGWDEEIVLGQVIRDEAPSGARGDSKAAKDKNGANTHEGEKKAQGKADSGQNDHGDGRDRHRAYIRQAQANIDNPEAVAYLSSRGIDMETARAWGLGYDPNPPHGWQDANKQWHRSGRIVIPWPSVDGEEPYYHVDRAIDGRAKNLKYDKPKTEEVGPQPTWNPNALKAPAFFVVEGQMDALAVAACGYEAVALGSTKDTDLPKEMAEAKGVGVALLMLDNDEAGHRAQGDLAAELREKGLPFLEADVAELGAKDAGEAWAANRDHLKAALDGCIERLRRQAETRRMVRYNIVDPAEALRDLYDLKEGREPIPTGYDMLDGVTGGGLHAKSLHVIGAQSSEGKTTLTLDIADNAARAGHPVLFVTIEQRTSELIAKSLARIAYAQSGGDTILTARSITNPAERREWDADKWQALKDASDEYAREIAPNMQFMDPDEPPTVETVWEWAAHMAEQRGEAPLVVVDYLQLLAPAPGHERDSDKQVTDKNVTLLRRMAGGLNTPVWVVASLNRQSYTAPISTDSFKESGAIEYGADVLLGLEPFDLETRYHNATEKSRAITAKALHDKTQRATKRWMDLRVLKNRFGTKPEYGLSFVYHANADLFETVWKVRRERRADDSVELNDPIELGDTIVL